jgi:hypothetical protein
VFFTRTYPSFTELYDLFYVNYVKVVPTDIYNLITPIALAHWIMGDGGRVNKGLMLCTHNFSVKDVVRLINVLIIKYQLDCSIHLSKGMWTINIKKTLFLIYNL